MLPWFRDRSFATIIDVGANVGQFSSLARSAFPAAKLVAFEPIPDCARDLRARFADDPAVSVVECALGDTEGEVVLHRNEFSPSSSILPMDERHKSAFPHTTQNSTIVIPQRRLDDVLAAMTVADPFLLKLDVQGYELHVLRGATRTLERAHTLLVEISLQRLYTSEPLFDETYRFIADAGFRLVGVADMLRDPRDKRPLQLDAVFERA